MTNTYFKDHEMIIKSELDNAQVSISIAVAWISFDVYEQSLLNAQNRGVVVRIITTEIRGKKSEASYNNLVDADISIEIIKPATYSTMHHKFAIIDSTTILTGSYNWTHSANTNFENLTVIKSEPAVVAQFQLEFQEVQYYTISAYQKMQSNVETCDCSRVKTMNFLVFSNTEISSIERWGDIISYCPRCESFKSIDQVQNTSFHSLSYEYETIDPNDYSPEQYQEMMNHIDRKITLSICREYIESNLPVHAVGMHRQRMISMDGDTETYTKIMWKHRLFADRIPDEFETDFDVFYEDTSNQNW